MNQITRNNFLGLTLSAAALAASGALVAGCGQAPAVKAAGVALAGPPVNPTLVVPNAQGLVASQSITSLSAAQQAQINALLGNYTGSFQGYDNNGNLVNQTYTMSLARGSSPSIPGQTFAAVNFSAGPMTFTSLMATGTPMSAVTGGSGLCYEFVSAQQTVIGLDSNGPFFLNLQLCLNSANQFDATQPQSNMISIVDYADFMSNQSSSNDDAVVQFNGDFQKH